MARKFSSTSIAWVLAVIVPMVAIWVTVSNRAATPAGVAVPGHPQRSPSGRYELIAIECGRREWCFHIQPTRAEDSAEEFTIPDRYRPFHRLYAVWGTDDTVWIYSSDIGTYLWRQTELTTWTKTAWVDTDEQLPERIRGLVPHPVRGD